MPKRRMGHESRSSTSRGRSRFIKAKDTELPRPRLWDLRQKRDREMQAIPEWEELRSLASAIKEHTLTHLDDYLEQFEASAKRTVPSSTGRAMPRSTTGSSTTSWRASGARTLVKSKSMLTEECEHAALPGAARHRGDRDRSRRAHPAARRRAPEPHRGAGRAQAARRRRRACSPSTHRHRPRQQRRALSGRERSGRRRGPISCEPRRA